jgi:hypothetical protein
MSKNNRWAGIDRREFMKVSAATVAMLFIEHVGKSVLTPFIVN